MMFLDCCQANQVTVVLVLTENETVIGGIATERWVDTSLSRCGLSLCQGAVSLFYFDIDQLIY